VSESSEFRKSEFEFNGRIIFCPTSNFSSRVKAPASHRTAPLLIVRRIEGVRCSDYFQASTIAPSTISPAPIPLRIFSFSPRNVIANAIKYSPPGGEIRVSVRKNENDLLIEVTDSGYGIGPEDVTSIFEKFYRVPRAENADEPGAGLGLAFVREIMDSHGGHVAVESQLGAGSTFTLRLPVELKEDDNLKNSVDV